jgi:hypothetical protein
MFARDLTHYSEEGHIFMKNAIVEILTQVKAERHDEVNPWANVDVCRSWFETGKDKSGISPAHHADMTMVQFGESKYALEARSPNSWIEVNNPSTQPLEAYVEFMVSDHPTIYPDVKIVLLNSADKPEGIKIKPEANNQGLRHHLHVVKTADLGLAPPGSSFMHIKTLGPAKEHAFRVVGTILSSPLGLDNMI